MGGDQLQRAGKVGQRAPQMGLGWGTEWDWGHPGPGPREPPEASLGLRRGHSPASPQQQGRGDGKSLCGKAPAWKWLVCGGGGGGRGRLQKSSALQPPRAGDGGSPARPSSRAWPPGLARQLTVAAALARLLQGVAGLQRWGGCRRNCGCRHLGALPPLPPPRCSAPFPCIIDDSQQHA